MGEEQFCREQFSDDQINALTICTLVASLLSVIGSSFMLENFFLYDKGRNPLTKLVAWLAFGDYLTAINNIIKSLMLLHYPDLFGWEACVVMRSWFQIAAGSTWCYTSVIAYFLYRFTVNHTTRIGWPMWIAFHVASWGVPAAGVVVMVSGNFVYKSPNTGLCYPSEPWHIILWFIPIIISFVWMLGCYAAIFYRLWRNSRTLSSRSSRYMLDPVAVNAVDAEENTTLLASHGQPDEAQPEAATQADAHLKRVQLRQVVVRFSFYILVFFICWFFDVVTYFILFFNNNCNVYAFTFGYTLFRNLQARSVLSLVLLARTAHGMLDCLVYGMTNLKIRQRFTHSILSAIVSTWELLLAPVLVLPAFIAYTSKLLQPYFSADKSDKIFVSVNDELMKDHERERERERKRRAYYKLQKQKQQQRLSQPSSSSSSSPAMPTRSLHEEERDWWGKDSQALPSSSITVPVSATAAAPVALDGGPPRRPKEVRRGPDGRRLIPAYYFNGEAPSPSRTRPSPQQPSPESGGESRLVARENGSALASEEEATNNST